MKNRKKLLTVALLFIAALPLSAQKQWTLDDCISYAMQNNITLQKTRLQQQSAAEDVKAQKGALLPTINASTNQSIGYRPWQDNGVATVTNGQVNSKVDKSYYNGSYNLNASWTVWNGGRNRNNVRLSELTAQQSELNVAEQANSIEERICQLFVQCLYLNEAISVSRSTLETSKKNEERGREMVEVGLLAQADLAQLTAQRANDEYSIVEAESQLANYKLQLRQLLQLTQDADFDIAVDAPLPWGETGVGLNEQALSDIPALQTVYEQALTSRPEIENARLGIESSKLNIAIAKAGWLPTLSLTSGVSTSTNSLSNNGWGNQMKTNVNMSGGLSLSIPIFDGKQTKTNVAKARIQQQQAVLDLQDQQQQLYQTIEGYWLDATTNQQKFRAASTSVASSQASFDLLQEQFNVGLKNIVELMNGKDNLLQAQQNQLQAKYLTLLNQQMLRFYSGALKN
ncbi:MAG: TolC family protein [Prevotella sp.]|nr:TolC family protein [Prevotella sp.]